MFRFVDAAFDHDDLTAVDAGLAADVDSADSIAVGGDAELSFILQVASYDPTGTWFYGGLRDGGRSCLRKLTGQDFHSNTITAGDGTGHGHDGSRVSISCGCAVGRRFFAEGKNSFAACFCRDISCDLRAVHEVDSHIVDGACQSDGIACPGIDDPRIVELPGSAVLHGPVIIFPGARVQIDADTTGAYRLDGAAVDQVGGCPMGDKHTHPCFAVG